MFAFLFKKEHRNFFRLWMAQLVSQFGDRIHQLALVALIAERSGHGSGNAMDLAKVMSFTILPTFLIQPLAGVFVDRWDRRTTLFICDLARAFLVLLIPFIFIRWETMVPIYIIVFLIFCFPRLYVPAKMSIIPDLVKTDENLLKANSLITTTGMIAAALGVALGAVIMEWYGSRNGFFIDAATFLISALFLWGMDLPWRLYLKPKEIFRRSRVLARDIRQRERTVLKEIKDGFRYILSRQDIRFVMEMMFLLFGAVGAVYVVIIVFIQEVFQTVTKDLGVMIFALVIGLFLGVVLYGRFGTKTKWYRTIYFCVMVAGILLAAFAVGTLLWANYALTIGLAVSLGMAIGPIFVAANTIAHIVSDDEMRGKVFSAMEIIIHGSFLVTMLLSSWLSGFVGEVWILVVTGSVCAILGMVGLLRRDLAIGK